MGKIVAVVLVAGLSRRMGAYKPLLPFKNKSIISHLIEQVLQSDVDETIVITGHNSDLIAKELEKFDVKLVFNKDYKEGMHSSVMCAAQNMPDDVDAFMILLGDQPQIDSSVINNVIECWKESNKGIVIPSYLNKRGHPIILDKKYIDQAANLDPKKGLKALIENNSEDIDYLNVETNDILLDIDTPYDYSKVLGKD